MDKNFSMLLAIWLCLMVLVACLGLETNSILRQIRDNMPVYPTTVEKR